MKKFTKKILSSTLSLLLLLSSIATLPMSASAESTQDASTAIRNAAEAYVEANQNNSTKVGLLAAVKTVAGDATLADDDYFMKHAVSGVKDDDTTSGYPISIPGSDGAVSAVFEYSGERISFVKSFKHTEEVIHINEVAVVGTSEGFEYSGKDVIGYNGTADKIVFPASYHGAMTKLSDKSSVDNVKAVFIDTDDKNETWQTCARLKEYSYSGWQSLVAVEFGENAHPRMLFDNATKNESGENLYPDSSVPGIFKECPNLKYVKLPRKLYASQYTISGSMFENCKNLENVIFYENSANDNKPFANRAFAYTNLRDVFLPSWAALNETQQANAFYGAECRHTERGGQVINYSVNMTFTRAVALIASALGNQKTTDNIVANAKSAVVGSHDAATFAVSLTYNNTIAESDYAVTGGLEISNGTDTFAFDFSKNKALNNLNIGYTITPAFAPDIFEYSAIVPADVEDIVVSATPADGAIVSEINGTHLSGVENTVTVSVLNTAGRTVNYSINITKRDSKIDQAIAAASEYIERNQNNVVKSGLLEAIRSVLSSATIADSDYFMKHAVPGVKDDDTTSGYPISIPGSDGAVSAVFEYEGVRYGFVKSFKHTEEVIHINEVAVVGTSEGFEYRGKDVVAYNGTADKIVFPRNYHGMMTKLSDKSSVDRVKAVYIDTDDTGENWQTCTRLKEYSYSGWQSLVAVEFGENAHSRLLIDNATTKSDGTKLYPDASVPGIFKECPELKYVKLPHKLVASQYNISGSMFENCSKLENVIFYENSENDKGLFAVNSFAYTNIYDVFLPSWADLNETQQGYAFSGSKCRHNELGGQIIRYSENMTFMRAAALIASALGNQKTTDNIVANAKSAVVGSHDAATFADSIAFVNSLAESDYGVSGSLILSYDNDSVTLDLSKSKSLTDLDIDYSLTPSFAPNVTDYNASVPNTLTSLNVKAIAADGAQVVSVSGNTDLKIGTNTVTVKVRTTDGKYVDYTITVTRKARLSDDAFAAADAYVQAKQNTVTKAGLLQAVKTVIPTANLSDEDFYIRHAVPGVVDNDDTSGAQLSIPGSDGSVSAVFTINEERLSFNTTFSHVTQKLHISNYAVVGDSGYESYFEYDASGNVTAIKKPVDKLIFPTGYNGGMTELTDEDSRLNADRVKVVIYNGLAKLKNKAFYGWDGLIAVQMGNQLHDQYGFALGDYGTSAFSECGNLKYFKFPNHINTSGYNNGGTLLPNSFFADDIALENVIFPMKVNGIKNWYDEAEKTVNYGFWALKNTAIREALLPKINLNDGINYPATGENANTFLGSSFSEGTRNIHYYAESMNVLRAASLIDSALSAENCTNETQIISVAKNAIVGSYNATSFAETLQYHWFEGESTDMYANGILVVSDGADEIFIDAAFSKTLSSLTAGNYNFDVDFNADIRTYKVTVPYDLDSLSISATAVDGASVGAIRTDISKIDPIEINVTNTDGKNIVYTVELFRNGTLSANNLVLLKKALLGVDGGIEVDLGGDRICNLLDLVAMKKLLASKESVDSVSTIHYTSLPNGTNADQFYSALAYLNPQGEITDTLFDCITFGAGNYWMYSYNPEVPMIHNKEDWYNFIYNNLFQDNYNVNALEVAAGRVKRELNSADYKAGVYLPLFYTQSYFENWGTVNSKTLDFTNNEDRIVALKWLVDEMIKAFNEQKYSNLKLQGFYYVSEGLSKDDLTNLKIILPVITDYIRNKGLMTYFAPYNGAYGSNRTDDPNWKNCGFDEATYQINYFPGAETLPNAQPEASAIEIIAEKAAEMGASVQMELCSLTERDSIGGLKEYLKGGIKYGYMNNEFISWWIQGNGDNLSRLCNSDDVYLRSAYDETYAFIHKTLKTNEIYTEQ